MKERSIIFNANDVRAILAGRKTQTRRIVKLRYGADVIVTNGQVWKPARVDYEGYVDCPFGAARDRLWVRENWAWYPLDHDASCVIWRADYEPDANPPAEFSAWKSSANMPRWASRITLKITGVRVERLQDISEGDAIAEGVENSGEFFGCPCWRDYMEPNPELSSFPDDPVGSFASLWESIHGPDSWDQNPWVWVIEFRRVEP